MSAMKLPEAGPPKPTRAAALLLALILSVPFAVLAFLEAAWRAVRLLY